MNQKVVSFSEPMYGPGQFTILTEGKRLAKVLLNPPEGTEDKALFVRRKMESAFSAFEVDSAIDTILAAHGKDIVSGRSGASWSAVLWACATFLMGVGILYRLED